ncbi:hypothetical protein HWV07_06490 [Natronomonas salina]|uniref:hypothetical protein n=1 Tax=Natronomonas salina TaxID=1710540 RepID=UPI0015B57164|nr:hypothetical protein [Natronomonas salina]QLD88703.1 hypothetical protein HWV07_06490 [Natronomonas salina]
MGEPALHRRLRRIEQRQYLVLLLIGIGYILALAELVGVWLTGLLGGAVGAASFGAGIYSRKQSRSRNRDSTGP